MDPQAFQQTMAQYGPQQPQAAPTPTQPQQSAPTAPTPAQHGNWLTHLLPTIGGVGGGILGAVFGGGVGGFAGGAGGSAAGKALENELEGQSLGHDVALNGAEGAIGEGVGGVLGKVGGKVLGAIGNKSGQLADNLVKGQYGKYLSGEDANALRTIGASDARQIPQISSVITGSNGALPGGVKAALGESGAGVDITGIDKIAKNAMAEQGLKPSSIDSIGHNLTQSINNMVPGDVGSVLNKAGKPTYTYTPEALVNALPENVFAQTQKMEQLASQAYQKGFDKMTGQVTDADQAGQYKVYKQLADELEGRAFGTSTGNPLPLSETAKSSIIDSLAPLKDINPTVHANMVNQVTNAQNIQDLRPMQSLWVRANQATNAVANAADKTAGTSASQAVSGLPIAGAIAGGPHGMAAGLAAAALRSPTADRALVPIVENGGNLLSGISAAKIGQAGIPALAGGAGGVLTGTSNNMLQGSNNGTVGATNTMQDPNQPPSTLSQPPTAGLTRNDLITLALYSPSAFNSIVGAAGPAQQQVAGATAAEQALHGLGPAPAGGILSHVMGSLGVGHTGEYQRQAHSAAQQVAAALPGSDAGAIEKQLTDYQAGGGNVNSAIEALLSRLSSVVNNNKNSSYQDLMNYQGGQPQSVMSQIPAVVN